MEYKILCDLMAAYMVLEGTTASHRTDMDTDANEAAMKNLAMEFVNRMAGAIRLGGTDKKRCEFYSKEVQERIERVMQAIESTLDEPEEQHGVAEDEVHKIGEEDGFIDSAENFELYIWEQLPKIELYGELIHAGLPVRTTNCEANVTPDLYKLIKLTGNEVDFVENNDDPDRGPLMKLWTAQQLIKLLPPDLGWELDIPMRLMYYKRDPLYVVGYKSKCQEKIFHSICFADACAEAMLWVLNTRSLRHQMESYWESNKK